MTQRSIFNVLLFLCSIPLLHGMQEDTKLKTIPTFVNFFINTNLVNNTIVPEDTGAIEGGCIDWLILTSLWHNTGENHIFVPYSLALKLFASLNATKLFLKKNDIDPKKVAITGSNRMVFEEMYRNFGYYNENNEFVRFSKTNQSPNEFLLLEALKPYNIYDTNLGLCYLKKLQNEQNEIFNINNFSLISNNDIKFKSKDSYEWIKGGLFNNSYASFKPIALGLDGHGSEVTKEDPQVAGMPEEAVPGFLNGINSNVSLFSVDSCHTGPKRVEKILKKTQSPFYKTAKIITAAKNNNDCPYLNRLDITGYSSPDQENFEINQRNLKIKVSKNFEPFGITIMKELGIT
jgi:hypothetical protein